MMMTKEKFEREYAVALAIARKAHAGQKDKAGQDYIGHPLAVAAACDAPEAKITALLHDVIEDSNVTAADLREAGIDAEIVEAVILLTHDDAVDYFDYIRAMRDHPLAVTVKLADLAHNTQLCRIKNPGPDDARRVQKYQKAREMLEAR